RPNLNPMWNITGTQNNMRPTYLEVNLTQLQKNIEAIRAHVGGAKVMPMVKANAYGHGIEGVAPFIEPYVDMLGVALVEEGIQLRQLGIKKPILVAGGTLIEQLPLFFEHDLTLTASSPDLLLAANQLAESTRKRLTVHLKIDTGMERVGVREYEAEEFILKVFACSHLSVEGIYTHLANSELVELAGMPSHVVTGQEQLERFQEVLHLYEKHSLPVPSIRHVCNSGGILNLPDGHLDMVRPGVLFYGVYPGRDIPRTIDVKPALTWKSRVSYSKVTQPGRAVSYGSLWQVEGSPKRVVTIPCGYADGYFRRMTNQGRVLINGKSYSQVGRICMDQFMVDAGSDDVTVGDEVILLGSGIAPEELADWAGTNEYEVMTNISARVPRVFVGGVQ
ncbi:MAG TPA: alanine racemase, partial [Anaerolineales bacterium]|nr:alanine racemase [Anaerolineales bacterium]